MRCGTTWRDTIKCLVTANAPAFLCPSITSQGALLTPWFGTGVNLTELNSSSPGPLFQPVIVHVMMRLFH